MNASTHMGRKRGGGGGRQVAAARAMPPPISTACSECCQHLEACHVAAALRRRCPLAAGVLSGRGRGASKWAAPGQRAVHAWWRSACGLRAVAWRSRVHAASPGCQTWGVTGASGTCRGPCAGSLHAVQRGGHACTPACLCAVQQCCAVHRRLWTFGKAVANGPLGSCRTVGLLTHPVSHRHLSCHDGHACRMAVTSAWGEERNHPNAFARRCAAACSPV